MKPIVYPEDIQCVYQESQGGQTGRIFIGNLEAAQNKHTLRKHSVRAVVSAAKGAFLPHSQEELPSYLYIPADDVEHFDLQQYFQKAISFIERNLPHTNVLVHCLAGVSRSVTLVIAFLMKRLGKSFGEAYAIVKARRPIINPNSGFIAQLRRHEMQLVSTARKQQTDRNSSQQSNRYASPTRALSPKARIVDRFKIYNPESVSLTKDYLPSGYHKLQLKPFKEEDPQSLRRHNEYLEERIRKLREDLGYRTSNDGNRSKLIDLRENSPEQRQRFTTFNRYDSYRLKTQSLRSPNAARMIRSTRN